MIPVILSVVFIIGISSAFIGVLFKLERWEDAEWPCDATDWL